MPKSEWGIVVVTLAFSLAVPAQRQSPEPETFGVVHYFDEENGHLVALERQAGKTGWKTLGLGGAAARIDGERSPVRFRTGTAQQFVVRLVPGADPNKFQLFGFQRKGRQREVKIVGSTGTPRTSIPFDATRFGDQSYRLKPVRPLEPGEYGFSPSESNQVFAFGIDAPAPK